MSTLISQMSRCPFRKERKRRKKYRAHNVVKSIDKKHKMLYKINIICGAEAKRRGNREKIKERI